MLLERKKETETDKLKEVGINKEEEAITANTCTGIIRDALFILCQEFPVHNL